MEIVQAKLQECINSGQLNSFDRLSNLFSGKSNNAPKQYNAGDNASDDGDVVMNGDLKSTLSGAGKDASKIPTKKSNSQKHSIQKMMTSQYGDRTSRKISEKKHRPEKPGGRGRSGVKLVAQGRLRSSSKKRGGSGKKLASI